MTSLRFYVDVCIIMYIFYFVYSLEFFFFLVLSLEVFYSPSFIYYEYMHKLNHQNTQTIIAVAEYDSIHALLVFKNMKTFLSWERKVIYLWKIPWQHHNNDRSFPSKFMNLCYNIIFLLLIINIIFLSKFLKKVAWYNRCFKIFFYNIFEYH